jgi:hypothetical protein
MKSPNDSLLTTALIVLCLVAGLLVLGPCTPSDGELIDSPALPTYDAPARGDFPPRGNRLAERPTLWR